jgi:hypothetical protein
MFEYTQVWSIKMHILLPLIVVSLIVVSSQ